MELYVDDIVVFGQTAEACLANVQRVLQRAKLYKIRTKDVPREVAQWLMYLQDFNFKTEHRTGNRMKHVDSLSRYPVFVVTAEIRARIVKAQQSNEHLKAVSEILKEKAYGNFVIKDELIYKQLSGRDVLALPKRMEKEIIDKANGVEHMVVQKTMHAIEQDYFIPHIEHKVRQHTANCIECILHNRKDPAATLAF